MRRLGLMMALALGGLGSMVASSAARSAAPGPIRNPREEKPKSAPRTDTYTAKRKAKAEERRRARGKKW